MALAVSVSLELWVVLGLFALTVLVLTCGYIPNDRVGIVEKLWSSRVVPYAERLHFAVTRLSSVTS